jgi:hypothetical protein
MQSSKPPNLPLANAVHKRKLSASHSALFRSRMVRSGDTQQIAEEFEEANFKNTFFTSKPISKKNKNTNLGQNTGFFEKKLSPSKKRTANNEAKSAVISRPKSLVDLRKAASEVEYYKRDDYDKNPTEKPVSEIKTPLPTTTCSKRLNTAKSTLSFCKTNSRVHSVVQFHSVAYRIY